jgi:peptidoglycan/xylan/chitin deacetylase (PgdA/CDA1 family)
MSGEERSTPVLRVRWDRVVLLLVGLVALVLGLVVISVHAVHAVHNRGLQAAAPRVTVPPPGGPVRAEPDVTCPEPSSHLLREAPRAGKARTVALTFDDGPGEWTPEVLAVLQKEHVHATFFVIGREAAAHPKTLRKIAAGGHVIGNHTWSHPTPSSRTGWRAATLSSQIDRTQRAVVEATGRQPCLFRPPGGVFQGAEKVSRRAGVSIVLWSVDPRDWASQRQRDVALIRQRARLGLEQQHPVILLHDGGGYRGATLAALPGIIEDYRSQGYLFVTLDHNG